MGKVFSYLEMINLKCLQESASYWALYLQLQQGHCFHPTEVQSFYLCFLRNVTLLIILCHKSVQRTGTIYQLLSFLKSLSGFKKRKIPSSDPTTLFSYCFFISKKLAVPYFILFTLYYNLGSSLLSTVIAFAMVTNVF